jgi:hypothetical protein
MKPAKGIDCLLDQPLHLTGIGNIRAHKKALAACLGQQFDGFCTRVVYVADHDFGAMFRKRERSRPANTSAAAGNQRDLAAEVQMVGHERLHRFKSCYGQTTSTYLPGECGCFNAAWACASG